jgi:hypothetical protein
MSLSCGGVASCKVLMGVNHITALHDDPMQVDEEDEAEEKNSRGDKAGPGSRDGVPPPEEPPLEAMRIRNPQRTFERGICSLSK